MNTMKLKKGERFMARWPSTQFYYWATLLEPAGEDWKIQFDDGTISVVNITDLHDTPPADARNPVGRITRSSPTKNRKRPEEIKQSPARKVRKLFSEEENLILGAKLTDVKGPTESVVADNTSTHAADNKPSHEATSRSLPFRRSPSVKRQAEDVTHSSDAADVRSTPLKKLVSVNEDIGEVKLGSRSTPFKMSITVKKLRKDVTHNAAEADAKPSPFKSAEMERESVTRNAAEADEKPSTIKSATTTEIEGEIVTEFVTRSVKRYTESFEDRDFRRQLFKERSVGSANIRPSPVRGPDDTLRKTELTHGSANIRPSPVRGPDDIFRERELTHGSANIRPSPVRGPEDILKERDLTRGSANIRPSPVRGPDDILRERELTHGSANIRPSPVRGPENILKEIELTRGSANIRPSPGPEDILREIELIRDVAKYADSYLEKERKRRPLKEGSADIWPSPIKASNSLLNERGTVADDLTRYTSSYLDRDFRRRLMREGSVGTRNTPPPTPYRKSRSVMKEDDELTCGSTLKDYKEKYLKKHPMEFGGRIGTLLLILLLPFYIMSVFVFNLVPEPRKFEIAFEKQIVLITQVAFGIIILLFGQAILTLVPIGTVASGPLTRRGILNVRCNGIFAAFFTLIPTLSACYFKREFADIVVSVYSEAAVSAMVLGIIFSLILYRRADKMPISYLNPYGSTGYRWYDFWMGREVTPCIAKFNVKLVLHRFSIIIAIALNVLIVTKAYFQGMNEAILKNLMMSAIVQFLYCTHLLFREDVYLYSFLALSEGVGYMITVGFMTFPFILTFTTKAILDYRLIASWTEMLIAVCAYIVGYFLLSSSNYRKKLSVRDPATALWRMTPLPKWSHNIQTRAYVGEIIIYWAFAMFAGTTYPWLFIIPAAFTFSVLSRAAREYTRAGANQVDEVDTKQ